MNDVSAQFRPILPAPGRASKPSSDDVPDDYGLSPSPVANQPKLPKRIRSVAQACQICRQMKAKCDGGRPRCSYCIDRDRPCGYEGEAGQSRQAAMRARLAAFESVFASLRTADPAKTTRLLQRLRNSDDPLVVLREETGDSPSSESNTWTPSSDLSAPTSADTQQTNFTISPRVSPKLTACAQASNDLDQNSSPRQTVALLLNIENPAIPAPVAINLVFPDFLTTTRAVSDFFDNQASLYHVFSQDEVKSFLDIVFEEPAPRAVSSDDRKLAMSCLAAVVAVGMRFSSRYYDKFTSNAVYCIAKQYFELALSQSPFLAIKIAALLALYNLMSRNSMALIWVNAGLRLSRSCGLCNKTPTDAAIPISDWTRHRKTWRTLVFLSCWLSSAMCTLAGQEIPAERINPAILDYDTAGDIREIVQMESVKVVILTVEILRIYLSNENITIAGFESVTRDLRSWYDKLPHEIHLGSLEQNSTFPLDVLRAAYQLHLLYMGAVLLIYRRIVSLHAFSSSATKRNQEINSNNLETIPISLLQQGITAARTSASICSLLLQDDASARRSWIVLLQAYSAGTVLLHIVAQKQAYDCHPDTWQGDMRRAEACLHVLSHNSAADAEVRELYSRLALLHETLALSPTLSSHNQQRPNPCPGVGRHDHNCHNCCAHESQETVSLLLTLPPHVTAQRTHTARELMAILEQPFHSLQSDTVNQRIAPIATAFDLPQISGLVR
ncbi:hypothetical protein SEPCBS119000_002953 [Sporothrix epigloea]|uniref:Zn(2)-C6 fungal-type domain-containing protein n=1 Tax=Sporothrix epigloea TaxID=1892477 RepID=A0ABP0DK87_9PEZI